MYPQDLSTYHLLDKRGWTVSFCLCNVLNYKLTPPSLASSEICVWILGYSEEYLANRKQFQEPSAPDVHAVFTSLKQSCVF